MTQAQTAARCEKEAKRVTKAWQRYNAVTDLDSKSGRRAYTDLRNAMIDLQDHWIKHSDRERERRYKLAHPA